jgi:hypothetical protein
VRSRRAVLASAERGAQRRGLGRDEVHEAARGKHRQSQARR